MIKFHEGDFYEEDETSPLFGNDGETELYYHLRNRVEGFLDDIRVMEYPRVKTDIILAELYLHRLLNAIQDVKLGDTIHKMKEVESSFNPVGRLRE